MTARETIRNILRANLYESHDEIAQEIRAALVAGIPDLVWEHHPAGLIASNGCGWAFIIDTRRGRPSFLKWPTGDFAPDVDTVEAAKAAANAHNRATIAAAAGVLS